VKMKTGHENERIGAEQLNEVKPLHTGAFVW
jgi:hypothetical protein